jgi:hypothetical protein
MGIMRKLFFLFVLISSSGFVNAQKLDVSVPFSSASAFIEPNPSKLVVKLPENEFVSLAKVKGGLSGSSDFVLEKYGLSLVSQYKQNLSVADNEDIVKFFYSAGKLIVLTNIHDKSKKMASLKCYVFEPSSGSKIDEKILKQYPVKDWMTERYKGTVKESYRNNIYSYLNSGFIIPFQYQFNIEFSPDNSKMLAYFYDYSQKTLVVHTSMYDAEMNVIAERNISVDNNFVNYGLFPNNRSEFYILNADKLGRIVLVQYNIADGTNKFLDLQYSSSVRESLVLKQLNDDVVYIANTNVKNDVVQGIMYTKFNFIDNLVEKINYYEISLGLKQTVEAARSGNKSISNIENWKNYEITHFFMNEYEKLILVLEKRELTGGNFKYSGSTVHDLSHWGEKEGRISVEGLIMFAFNRDDEIIWENFYLKSQIADVNIGLLGASVELDNSAEGKLRMVYASSDNSSGVFNILRYVEWDEYSGSRIKEINLENKDKLSLMRSHLLWWDDKVMLIGRRGLVGKKTVMNLYDLN